jgi:hypothetical protein
VPTWRRLPSVSGPSGLVPSHGDLERCPYTDGTGETRPWRVERQQEEFEIEDIAGGVPPGRAGNGADAFAAEDREQARDDGPAVRRPEP